MPVFRSPENNNYLTRALFLEECYGTEKTYVIYTLAPRDHKNGYKSFHNLYMSISDPTEMRVALELFENYEHWKQLSTSNWFKPYLAKLREELDLRLRSKALMQIVEISKDETSKANYAANKFLLTEEYGIKNSVKQAGRPSKEAIKREAEFLLSSEQESENDLKRITN